MKVVIIGGVAGGASAAARLRRLAEDAEIILFERGDYISFANCGLPYYIGGTIRDKASLTLQTPASFRRRFAIDVRTGEEIIAIDPSGKTVTVRRLVAEETYTESYDKLILSPGAAPILPFTGENIFSLRNIPDTYRIKEYLEQKQPQSAAIIGGGFIGLEMAENLHQAGLKVSIWEASPQIAGGFDREIAREITSHLIEQGIQVHTGQFVENIEQLSADMVILAIGVRPESALAKEAGLALAPNGAIIVNENLLSSDPHIYAVGDAVQSRHFLSGQPVYIPLAGPANKQGRMAADNICGLNRAYRGTIGSAIVKVFDLTAASAGLTESAIKKIGLPYDKVFVWAGAHASYYPGAASISLKVLFSVPDGQIIGAQAIGRTGVDKRIDVLATAIRAEMTGADLAELELAYAPPYSSAKDPVNLAGFMIDNILRGQVRQHHWDDIGALLGREDITLLDVRTAGEYSGGHIKGAINIPVDELRENLGRLDQKKPIYLNCHSGQRSYIAYRILNSKGFTCSNLAGGYRLYAEMTSI
ncbi:MAG: FAD-dependent oxidoreductase [Clostridiales bacterium]|nr:FAD-dependent oxidoreductase [Clostridiales bacterium]